MPREFDPAPDVPLDRPLLSPLVLLISAVAALVSAYQVGYYFPDTLPVRVGLIVVALVIGLRAVQQKYAEPTAGWDESLALVALLVLGLGLGLAAFSYANPLDPFRWLLAAVFAMGLALAVALVLILAAPEPLAGRKGRLEALAPRVVLGSYFAVAGMLAVAANFACDVFWDSFRLLLAVAAIAAFGGSLLVLLPRLVGRAALLLLVTIHLSGILSAVFSVAPPNAEPSWVANYLWTAFYRPYLQMFYLNNAYHFYSPEPGPPTLLWYWVEFDKGEGIWVKMPNREQYPTKTQYYRRLALTESTNQNLGPAPREAFDLAVRRRKLAGERLGIKMAFGVDPVYQYREPTLYSKIMIRCFSRKVALSTTHPKHPDAKVTSIKVYRVVHEIIPPQHLADGFSPVDDTLYRPFYMGKFEWGEIADPETKEKRIEWVIRELDDPLLYWMIPIQRESPNEGDLHDPRRPANELVVKNYLDRHAHGVK